MTGGVFKYVTHGRNCNLSHGNALTFCVTCFMSSGYYAPTGRRPLAQGCTTGATLGWDLIGFYPTKGLRRQFEPTQPLWGKNA